MNSGIYILLLYLPESRKIKIGALGSLQFKKGFYIYIGSAQKNLRKRIERHMRKKKTKRWHIDYLLSYSEIRQIFVKNCKKKCEEETAKKLEKNFPFIENFGSSDTNAKSHLFFITNKRKLIDFIKKEKFIPL